MKISFKRRVWLSGLLVAGLHLTGCSGGGGDDLEEPMDDSEELVDNDIDSAMADMESEASENDVTTAEPMEDYSGDSSLGDQDSPTDDEQFVSNADEAADSAEEIAEGMDEESDELADKLDSVSDDDVENYKLDDQKGEGMASEPEPMPANEDMMDDSEESVQMNNPVAAAPSKSEAVAKSRPVSGNGVRYIARPGDTLAVIATRIFGDSSRWRELAEKNNISNPSNIYPGDVIVFDVTSETQAFANTLSQVQMQTVVVEAGDSLSAIAKRVIGDGNAWKYLWRFNEERIDNPDVISVGQVISYMPVDDSTGIARAGQGSTIR